MDIPSGKRLHDYGKSPSLMGKLTINVPCSSIFYGYVELPEGKWNYKEGMVINPFIRIYVPIPKQFEDG